MDTIKTPLSWEKVWMQVVNVIAQKSKDPNTKVGAVIVSPDNTRCTLGYNGFPVGIIDTKERWERPAKYTRVVHAECNAILNAKTNLSGWTLYVTMPPCDKCSLLLIQSGIKRIVYLNDPSSTAFDYSLSFELLKEAGIEINKYKGDNNE